MYVAVDPFDCPVTVTRPLGGLDNNGHWAICIMNEHDINELIHNGGMVLSKHCEYSNIEACNMKPCSRKMI